MSARLRVGGGAGSAAEGAPVASRGGGPAVAEEESLRGSSSTMVSGFAAVWPTFDVRAASRADESVMSPTSRRDDVPGLNSSEEAWWSSSQESQSSSSSLSRSLSSEELEESLSFFPPEARFARPCRGFLAFLASLAALREAMASSRNLQSLRQCLAWFRSLLRCSQWPQGPSACVHARHSHGRSGSLLSRGAPPPPPGTCLGGSARRASVCFCTARPLPPASRSSGRLRAVCRARTDSMASLTFPRSLPAWERSISCSSLFSRLMPS